VGGMKRPCKALSKVPNIHRLGTTIHQRISQCLVNNPEAVDTVHRVVAENNKQGKQSEKHTDDVRQILTDPVGATDASPVPTAECRTTVRAGLLATWRREARDPDGQPEIWCSAGAPAGIRVTPLDRGCSRWCTTLTTTQSSLAIRNQMGPAPCVAKSSRSQ